MTLKLKLAKQLPEIPVNENKLQENKKYAIKGIQTRSSRFRDLSVNHYTKDAQELSHK